LPEVQISWNVLVKCRQTCC